MPAGRQSISGWFKNLRENGVLLAPRIFALAICAGFQNAAPRGAAAATTSRRITRGAKSALCAPPPGRNSRMHRASAAHCFCRTLTSMLLIGGAARVAPRAPSASRKTA
jgi:hypothetical protein